MTKTSHCKLTWLLSMCTAARHLTSLSLNFLVYDVVIMQPTLEGYGEEEPWFLYHNGSDLASKSMWSFELRQARFKSWFHGFLRFSTVWQLPSFSSLRLLYVWNENNNIYHTIAIGRVQHHSWHLLWENTVHCTKIQHLPTLHTVDGVYFCITKSRGLLRKWYER